MKIFLDSSFFFPFINVNIANVPKKKIFSLLNSDFFEIYCSEMTPFEISAKGWKYIHSGMLNESDLLEGITAFRELSVVRVMPISFAEIQSLAGFFKETHKDFIDCLILSSAINYSEIFISLDETLQKKYQELWKNNIEIDFPNFKFLTWSQFEGAYLFKKGKNIIWNEKTKRS